MLKIRIQKIIVPAGLILFAAVLRLIPHPPNVAPIAAMALFGGVYLDKKYALVIPLLTLFVSDCFLGFHQTMVFVYGSFLITGLIGIYIKRHKTYKNIFFGSITSSFIFYLITNFGVWFVGGLYPKNLLGLLDSYSMAIPFFRNTFLGDLFFTALFFGTYQLFLKIISKPELLKQTEVVK